MLLFSAVKRIAAGMAAQVICTLIDFFKKSFIDWLQTIPDMLSDKIDGKLIGCKTFIGNKLGYAQEASDNYSYNGTQWQKTTVSRNIDVDEVPEEYSSRLSGDEMLDITDELELTNT